MPRYSTIRLCVAPLDKTYKNTIWFDNTTDREIQRHNYFYLLPGQIFSNQSLCRINANTFRVQAYYEDLLCYNYMIFTNPKSEGVMQSREFYAFVDQINYINESTSEIVFTIDYLMTYMFDFKVQPSFVEREHSETDYMFEHHVEEGLETGEYVRQSGTTLVNFSDCDIGIACTIDFYNLPPFKAYEPLTGEYPWVSFVKDVPAINGHGWSLAYKSTNSVPAKFDPNLFQYNYGSMQAGVFQGYTLYRFPKQNSEQVAAFLAALSHLGVADSVKMVVPIPKDLVTVKYSKPFVFTPESANPSTAITVNVDIIESSSELHTFTLQVKYDAFYKKVKNNKCFCAPYVKPCLYNYEGGLVEYRPELFSNLAGQKKPTRTSYAFAYSAVTGSDTLIRAYPQYYEQGITEYSIELTGFPLGSWGYSVFDNWYAQNRNSLNWQYAAAGIGLLASTGIAVATLGASRAAIPIITATGNLAGGVASVGKLVGSVQDKKVLPNTAQGQIGNTSFNIANNIKAFAGVVYICTDEYIKIIDDYFTMYGYASHEVKVPNVFANKGRPYFNYLKTQNVTLVPVKLPNEDRTRYLSSEAINTISAILDNGITFWNCSKLIGANQIQVGDYTVDNSPVYLETNNALESEKEVIDEQK